MPRLVSMLMMVVAFSFTVATLQAAPPTPAQKAALKKQQAAKQKQLLEEKRKQAKAATKRKQQEMATPLPARPRPERNVDAILLQTDAIAQLIDDRINAKLHEVGVEPSVRADDAEFMRRVYLDLTGVIPSAEQARAFLESRESDKRAKLVDQLLNDNNYGRQMADNWMAKLVPTNDTNTRFMIREPFIVWITDSFNDNTPWDTFVYDMLATTGTVKEEPEVTFFIANPNVDKLTDKVGEYFMGLQLECAQCHNHPFTTWKQEEYWSMAAFFSKVAPDRARNMKNTDSNNLEIGVKEGTQANRRKDFFPETGLKEPAKFFQGDEPKLNPREPFRPVLAGWLTSPENPYFAKAFVNRTWAQLFGKGFINPIDDMHVDNPASHPELLAELTERFANGGFDTKALIRGICASDAYQRSCKPSPTEFDEDLPLFASMQLKVMTPTQLFDSLDQVVRIPQPKSNDKYADRYRPSPRDRFSEFFLAGAEQPNAVEYEAGIPQALQMMNNRLIDNPKALRDLVGNRKPAEAIEQMFLATLSRKPTVEESRRLLKYLHDSDKPQDGYSDILWTLLNSSEFVTVR